MKMNPKIKAQWVAALRSGKIKQARGQLRVGDAMCCLGVLCNLHAQARPEIRVVIDGESAVLSDHNDGDTGTQRTFSEIADAIEAQL